MGGQRSLQRATQKGENHFHDEQCLRREKEESVGQREISSSILKKILFIWKVETGCGGKNIGARKVSNDPIRLGRRENGLTSAQSIPSVFFNCTKRSELKFRRLQGKRYLRAL